MAEKKSVVVKGVEYASKSDAIRDMLANGMKKSDIAKLTESHYSFVVTIERKMLEAATPEAEAARLAKEEEKAKKAAEKAKIAEEKAKAREAREAERAEKRAAKEAAAAEKAKKRAAKEAEKAAALKKAAKVGKKTTKKVVTPVDDDDIAIALAADAEIPEDIAEQMRADGLID